MTNNTILEVRNLKTHFRTPLGIIESVNDVSFSLNRGETLALVGESGCGKSVTSLSIMGLVPNPGFIAGGEIIFDGNNLLNFSEKEMRAVRGNRISMIFQEPMTSLNPVFKVGNQINEVFYEHDGLSKKEATAKAIDLLRMVGIPSPEKRLHDYPHQLSGGMRQRVMIAIALASSNPGVLIADEPTTALDVTIQAQILHLINELKEKVNLAVLLITHDMGVVAQVADRVAVMYAGRKVEEADVLDLFENPAHPYTIGLLNSIPSNTKYVNATRIEAINGTVPMPLELGPGCPFERRCDSALKQCIDSFPACSHVGTGHQVHCHLHSSQAVSEEGK